MRTNRKWKIQDGGHRTAGIYISACRRDSNEISTAIPMFWGSSNPTVLWTSLCELTGSRKWSKMAAAEPEVLLQAEIWIFPLRFGRHIGFSTSGLVVQYSKCFHSIAGPRKWGASRRYLVAISSVSWDITISTSAAAILDFSLPVWSYSILSVSILFPLDCCTSKMRL